MITFFRRRKTMADMREKISEGAGTARAWTEKAADQAKQAAGAKTKEATSGIVGAVTEKVQEVAAGASELAGKAKDTAQEWASSVGDAAVQVKDKAQAAAGVATEKVGELGQDVTTLIRRYPLSALLVAAGAGFLLGQVLRRPFGRDVTLGNR
jgi:ElaB/YqjD/DUF883 family membrane-anchored ribosome-binding protein